MYKRWRESLKKIAATAQSNKNEGERFPKVVQEATENYTPYTTRQLSWVEPFDAQLMARTLEDVIETGDVSGLKKLLHKPPPKEQRRLIEEAYEKNDPVVHCIKRMSNAKALFLLCAGFSYDREYVEPFLTPCFNCCQCDHAANPFSDCIGNQEKDTVISATFLAQLYGMRDVQNFIEAAEAGRFDSGDEGFYDFD